MQANYANALCHLNATPLSVAVLAPCAWGVWLRGKARFLGRNGAWQGALNSAKHNMASLTMKRQSATKLNGTATKFSITNLSRQAQQTARIAQRIQRNTANLVMQTAQRRYFVSEKMHDIANTANSVWQVFSDKTTLATPQIQHGENGVIFAGKADKAKMEQCLLGETGKAKMGQCLGRGLLSRCSQLCGTPLR